MNGQMANGAKNTLEIDEIRRSAGLLEEKCNRIESNNNNFNRQSARPTNETQKIHLNTFSAQN